MSENVKVNPGDNDTFKFKELEEHHAVILQEFADWYVDILDNMIHAECAKFRTKLSKKYMKMQTDYVSFDSIDPATAEFRERVRQDVIENIYASYLKGKRHINAVKLVQKAIKQQWMLNYGT